MYFVDNQAEEGIYLHYYDSTHPGARKFIWEKVKKGYYQHGIKIFWLDACEPEMLPIIPENLRFYAGDGDAVANIYPLDHVRGFYEGMLTEGEQDTLCSMPFCLGGQPTFWRSGLVWRYYSTFSALRAQVKAGLNMGMSGIPWWTHRYWWFPRGNPTRPGFPAINCALVPVWTFCPIFRLHGHRLPNSDDFSGAENEVWSFGDVHMRSSNDTCSFVKDCDPILWTKCVLLMRRVSPRCALCL